MIKNKDGMIKCQKADGTIRWLAPQIVNNPRRLKDYGFKVMAEVVRIEPIITEPKKEEPKQSDDILKKQTDILTQIKETESVAKTGKAKRTRKPKTKK